MLKDSLMANKLRATTLIVSLRQNGVGHDKTCADAILPKMFIRDAHHRE